MEFSNIINEQTSLDIPDIENQLDPDILKIQEINKQQQIEPKIVQKHKKLEDVDIPIGLCGLSNLGNTCYLNASLQCLLNIPNFKDIMSDNLIIKELYDFIIKQLKEEDRNNYSMIISKSNLTITFQLFKLFNSIWKENKKQIEPINFKKLLGHKIDSFKNNNQQDAQESIMYILGMIDDETKKEINIEYNFFPTGYLEIFKQIEEQNISDIDCCRLESTYPDILELHSLKKAIDRYNSKSYSIITKYFQNMISSTLQCTECNYHTFNFDPSIMLSIQIPIEQCVNIKEIDEQVSRIEGASQEILEQIKKHLIRKQAREQIISLDQCLHNFNKIEILDDDEKWHCPNCNIKVKAAKVLNISLPSKIMIIHLKRFDYQGNKIDNLITFPINELNINKYMSNFSKKLGNFTYDLFAVTNHIGSMNGGHYFSFVKSITDSEWYCINDEDVIKIDESNIVSEKAYMLFYKLRE